MWSRYRYWLLCAGVVVIAAALRLWQLGAIPHGLTWDEAAIGYNGYAVITTRRDEWLVRLPISFRSFGDYKAPLAIMVVGLFEVVLGLEPWVVRLPFALAGIFAVVGMIGLTRHLLLRLGIKQEASQWLSLLAGLLLTISPWHLHFSRVGFESGMALTMVLWAAWAWDWAWWRLRQDARSTKQPWWWLVLLVSVVWWALSLYTYHSAKLVAPLLAGFLLLGHWRWSKQHLLAVVIGGALGLLLVRPLILDTLYGQGGERFNQASIFTKGMPLPTVLSQLGEHWLIHFSPGFLWQGETPTLRHGDGRWGVMYPSTVLMVVVGLGMWLRLRSPIAKKISPQVKQLLPLWRLAVVWIVVGLTPAVIGIDVPHSNRALLALPGFLLGAVSGCYWLWLWAEHRQTKILGSHGETNLLAKSMVGVWLLLTGLFALSYLHDYYTKFPVASADAFKSGYLEAFRYVIPYEKGLDGKPEMAKILFTGEYGQPYIYALFARKTNPIWYQGGSLIKYEFTDHITMGDLERHSTVVVAGQSDELPISRANHIVYGADGSVRFKIYVLP